MINTDLLTGLLVLAISGVAYLQSRSFTFFGGVFVDWTLFILVVLSGTLIIKGILAGERAKTAVEAKRAREVWFTVLGLIIYLLLIPVLGFLIASVVGFTLSGVLLSPRPNRKHIFTWAKAFGVGFLVTTIFYVLFKLALAVPLPGGILGIG